VCLNTFSAKNASKRIKRRQKVVVFWLKTRFSFTGGNRDCERNISIEVRKIENVSMANMELKHRSVSMISDDEYK
jgi:hypothetical protein